MVVDNINSKDYWEQRFSSGDWEQKSGRTQTTLFARSQVSLFRIDKNFSGGLVDFGCGLGDAIPVYKKSFPNAKLMGVDVSESAIEKCRERYGWAASFISGQHQECPPADIIVASNVFEHLSDDLQIAKALLSRCKELYITVPYKECPLCKEHLRAYDENYFQSLGGAEFIIFPSKGWSEYGLNMWRLKLKNLLRIIIGKPTQARKMQIMFILRGSK